MRNGRIDARAVTLKDLIEFAYDVEEDDMVRGGDDPPPRGGDRPARRVEPAGFPRPVLSTILYTLDCPLAVSPYAA